MKLNSQRRKEELTNKQKYHNFFDYVLNDDKKVLRVLLPMSRWAAAIIFTLFFIIIFPYDVDIILKIFIAVFALASWYSVYKFYKLGGTRNMPDIRFKTFPPKKSRKSGPISRAG